VLTSITANDVDTNPALTYSFGEVIHAENEAALDVEDETNSWFSIDRFSGKIILQKPLDYEARQEYQLKIVASDTAHVAQTTLTIRVTDVNDNAPVFQESAYHTTLPGKRIATKIALRSPLTNRSFTFRRDQHQRNRDHNGERHRRR
jgi:protocadherin-16/23